METIFLLGTGLGAAAFLFYLSKKSASGSSCACCSQPCKKITAKK